MLGYNEIKRLAKEVSIPVTELLALSPKNDPFYAGTPAARRDAEWFAEIWQRAGYDRTGAHLRKVHYWTLSHSEEEFTVMPNGQPYQNTQLCWGFLTQASKMARYLGLVDITMVQDNKNPAPIVEAIYSRYDHVYHEVDLPDLDGDLQVHLYGAGTSMAQPYHMEVWVEKSTMNSVLAPICQRYYTNLVTFEGEASITSCLKLVQRVKEAAAPHTPILFIDGNHNARLDAFTNANAVPFGDTIEQGYADLVRQGGRVLWYDGMQELDVLNHHIMHGERAGKSAAKATMEDDFGGAQSISAGHIHGIQKVYKRVKLPGSSRWVIVTSCFAGFAGNNPPSYVKRKRNQIRWIQACQLVTINPRGDDVHINEIPFHESADGGLIAVCGIEVLTVAADNAAARTRANAA